MFLRLTLLLTILASQIQASSATNFVKYQGVGYNGNYQEVTDMNEDTGDCSKKSTSFSGDMSPFDEDLSVHIRGPVKLKQFAVYYTSSSGSKKRDLADGKFERGAETQKGSLTRRQMKSPKMKYDKGDFNKRDNAGCTKTVSIKKSKHTHTVVQTAYITVTAEKSENNSGSDNTSANNNDNSETTQTSMESQTGSTSNAASNTPSNDNDTTTTMSSGTSNPSETSSSSSSTSSGWTRNSYYNADSQESDNLIFMNHLGGTLSGVFSYTFGNSLSYADTTGVKSSSSPQILADDALLESDEELVLFSSNKCTTETCGFSRNGVDAYAGWSGDYKLFVFEFQMPTSNVSSSTYNYDMPAIWLLNGKIPRTEQYGDCSCWATGCGEFDLWEVITEGSDELVNHIHDGQSNEGTEYDGTANGGGGSSDYFQRPRNDYVTFAAIFTGAEVYLKDVTGFDFSSSLDSSIVTGWMTGTASDAYFV